MGGDPEEAMPCAVAVELMHEYLIDHDDVMDGDEMRRNEPTIGAKYGTANAINVGDYMLAKAHEVILDANYQPRTEHRLLSAFATTLVRTGEGQALDINLRADPDFTVSRYMKLAKLKTGWYLVYGMVGGAIVAGVPDYVISSLWRLGGNLGTAFQIIDDKIDLTEGKGRGGEIGCDIKEGKPTILYAYSLEKVNEEERGKLIHIMKKKRENTTESDKRWVINLYRKYGVIDYAQHKAEELVNKGIDIISDLPFEKKGPLVGIAKYIAQRAI